MTTENSRPDAQFLTATDEQHVRRFRQRDYSCIIEVQEIAAVVRYICALEELHPANKQAPIEAISKLLGEAMDRAAANGANSRSMPDEYVAIAHFTCYPEEYGYAKPAPSPADERAATPIGYIRADDLKELAEGNGAIVSPRCRETDVPVFARAASANETGAEGAHEVDCADCGWHGSGNDLASGEDDGHGKRAVCPKCGADEEELSFAGLSRSPAMEAEAVAIPAGWKLVPIEPTSLMIRRGNQHRLLSIGPTWEAMLDAAPQPAQPDARVGLTDGRIARLRAAIEGECDGLHVDYHHAKAILAYLDDDRA